MLSRGFRIQADLVLVAASIPDATKRFYAPGQVEVRDGRVVEATGDLSTPADLRLEGYALLPGLVNPHTHLEFSDLTTPLPPGHHFPEWIASVLKARRQRGQASDEVVRKTIAAGLQESRAAGVAALVDMVTPPWTPEWLSEDEPDADTSWELLPSELRSQLPADTWSQLQRHAPSAGTLPAVIACLEQLGLSEQRIEPALRWRDTVLQCSVAAGQTRLASLGLSPHAPYSMHTTLLRETFRAAAEQQRLVAMHIAESPAERQWLDSGTGPFADLHAALGVDVAPPAFGWINQLIDGLAQAPRGLVVHGNYLTEREIEHLSNYRRRLSVVYCPRTHEHFGHRPYPLDAYAARGIRVVFGTDSRSTNPDLNLWQEARTALAKHSGLRPSAALAAISDAAAEAVGLQDQYGSLLAGRVAALNIVPLGERHRHTDIEERIAGCFHATARPIVLT